MLRNRRPSVLRSFVCDEDAIGVDVVLGRRPPVADLEVLVAKLLEGPRHDQRLAQGAMDMQRNADVRDVLANATGIGLGAVASAAGLASWPYRLETWLTRT